MVPANSLSLVLVEANIKMDTWLRSKCMVMMQIIIDCDQHLHIISKIYSDKVTKGAWNFKKSTNPQFFYILLFLILFCKFI